MVATALPTQRRLWRERRRWPCEAVNETEEGYPPPLPGHGLDL